VVEWEAVEWEAVEWDGPNEAHATRHGVSMAEIEQVLASGPVFRPTGEAAATTSPKASPTVADGFGWS
jgi:uncharacterized DUF497 family protein